MTVNNKTATAILSSAILLGGLVWHAATRITRLEETVAALRDDVKAIKSILYIPAIPQQGGPR